ncbi:MAG: DUF4097 domain-containing protein [Thermoanaerobaculaceae bacterium]|jgi:DUF4097 and DUF4098 domain-containing protein YvlB|nr:DUF4097 domain-containing protein [Thermoanaerobaculaceae bacterium]
MRRALLILVPILLLTGCRPPDRAPLTHHESRTFAASAGKLVKCDLRSLDLEVVVREGDAITAVVNLEVSASSSAFARRWIDNHTPSFADSADTLEIKVPSRHRSSLIVGYVRTEGSIVLTVPPRCRLEVASSSGDITVEGRAPLSAPVRLTTSSGDVTIAGGIGDLIMHTSSGELEVSREALASLEFESSSGDARVRSGCGRVLVDTTSGEIRLHELTGALSVDTTSGDLVASWLSRPAGPLRVSSTSGDVDLELPGDATLRGDVTTSSGELRSDFPATSERRGRRLSLGTAAGAIDVEIRTTSGDVHLRRGDESVPPPSPATPEKPAEHGVEL